MGNIVSPQDDKRIDELIEVGVLTKFKREAINLASGAAAFFCGDGRHFHDWYGFLAKAASEQRRDCDNPNIFVVSFAGGPLAIDPESPINRVINHTPVVEHNLDLIQELGYRRHILHAHYACVEGQKRGLGLYQNIEWTVRGKSYIELTRNPSEEPCCLFHRFKLNGERNTLHLSRETWLEWSRDVPKVRNELGPLIELAA